MKKILLSFLFFCTLIIVLLGGVLVSPYYYYNKTINHNYYSDWYSAPNFNDNLKYPSKPIQADSSNLGNDDLWRKFHFMDVVLPLPVKNPFFFVSPILKYKNDSKRTDFGLKLYGADEREIAKIYFMPNKFFPNEINSQKLFKLPLIKKYLKSIPNDKLWNDLFTVKIDDWNIPFSQMIYNLYLLQIRRRLLPDKFNNFSLVEGTSTASIQLDSINKDYTTELLLTNNNGVIYSFVLICERNNTESKLIRDKFLKEVKFRGGSQYLSNILYKEFKGLEYTDQIDHLGMLYLLSAWTHDMNQTEYIREMIQHLEKGEGNQRQLESLYSYAQDRYNETFTTKEIDGLELDDNILLQRNVELEKKKELEELKNKKVEVKEVELTPEEKMKLMLQKAKRNKRSKKNRMIID